MAASFFQSRMKVWYDDVLLYRYRVDRKERARLKNVKFTGKTSEKVMRVYIQSIELQLSSTYLHVITVIINWLNAYSTTFWLLYMLLLFKEGKNCMYMHLLFLLTDKWKCATYEFKWEEKEEFLILQTVPLHEEQGPCSWWRHQCWWA